MSRRYRWIGIAAGGAALACAAAMWLALALRPPELRTHEDLMGYALSQRGVAYEEIRIGAIWPDRVNLQYGEYAGPVTIATIVTLRDGRRVDGWIECRRVDRGCSLSIAALDIRDEALPEFSATRRWPWVEWLEERLGLTW